MDDKNTMLIDAAHPEETRVVVLKDNRVEEFDHESAAKRPLRGNIYLAKVTRVEPSLQAAFVEYGGNRHGFLAFNEIHPDYYQIPVADRERLLEAEAEDERAASAAEECDNGEEVDADARDADPGAGKSGTTDAGEDATVAALEASGADATKTGTPEDDGASDTATEKDADGDEVSARQDGEPADDREDREEDDADDAEARTRVTSDEDSDDAREARRPRGRRRDRRGNGRRGDNGDNDDGDDDVELVGSEDALEEVPERTRRPRRQYKIQEVIKRRQIILVQVVKEERGNKGAALTTYLSLAGRYTVLMPNTARGGGISRKITNPADRKRLRKIATELEVPLGMGLIVRTAGATRTKSDIKRDFEYLLRLWENVRELTLQSSAPALVYEEGNLIKRSIRDLYSKEIDEVLVAGDDAYREAKDFMRMLMPSHAKNVRSYKEPEPLFARYQIERQLNAMFSPIVTLASGGYVVVNQTEALVAIDVNSGKATRERTIEETALNTNLEAAAEIARQLKLRDLAGLIVIDFIDMEERRNNRSVERKFKDCLKTDRARIQVGRISHFGLMEMSRQRLRTGVLEGSTTQCPHCQGTGVIRSVESVALAVLRALEDAFMAGHRGDLVANTSNEVALYILNQKRVYVNDLEARYGCHVSVCGSDRHQGANFTIERAAATGESDRDEGTVIQMDWAYHEGEAGAPQENGGRKKSRQRKRKRKRRDEDGKVGADADTEAGEAEGADDSGSGAEDVAAASGEQDEGDEKPKRSRRRGKRGGRRNRQAKSGDDQSEAVEDSQGATEAAPADDGEQASQSEPVHADSDTSDAVDTGEVETVDAAAEAGDDNQEAEDAEATAAAPHSEAEPAAEADDAAEEQPTRPRTSRSRRRPRRTGNGNAQTDSDAEVPAAETATAAPARAEKAAPEGEAESAGASGTATSSEPEQAPAYHASAQSDRPEAESADAEAGEQAQPVTASATVKEEQDSAETRRGWWQRRLRGA